MPPPKKKLKTSSSSSSSKKVAENPLYRSLPPEVTAVASSIGLEVGGSERSAETTLVQTLAKPNYDNVKYHAYQVKGIDKKISRYSVEQKNTTGKAAIKRKKKEDKAKRKGRLTSRERRRLFDVTKSKDLRYEVLTGLNHLWRGYIQSVVSTIKSPSDELKLVRADFHGALFVVSAAKNPTLVGMKGIVIQETKNTFRMISEDNRILSIPKVGSIFAFQVSGALYKLTGSNIAMSPQQRARVKPKVRAKIHLRNDV